MDLETFRQNDKKQKLRIKQLEMDLENALKKTSVKGISERLFSGHSNSRSRGNSPALSSKRSVSVPQKKLFSGEKRKISTNLSISSNKNKYSRENSMNSEGFVGRWNRRNSPENNAKTKKPYLQKNALNNNNKKSLSINNKNPNFNKKSPININNSGKKNYEKPWLNNNNNNKKNSPLPKIGNNPKRNLSNSKKNLEEENLFKKLEDLRNKNKKKEETPKENQRKAVISNKENASESNIDERLNKLQNLLKNAKN